MSSRLRKNSKHVFECFLEVVAPYESAGNQNGRKDPWILQSYPASFKDKEAEKLKSIPHFVFPCSQLEVTAVQNFSFVLTNVDAHWTFGFCRLAPKSETALVILSSFPWHEIFYRLLNRAAEITHHSNDDGELERFLESIYSTKVPEFGSVFHVSWKTKGSAYSDFSFPIPSSFGLPSIPENRNLTEYYNACGVNSMLAIFASMLKERRIVVTSRKLSRLSGCVQAANALIYPMHWQHIFIPVLPNHLIDYLSAPMPFLIGVPAPIMQRVRLQELGDVVILDADANKIVSPFDDVGSLPLELVNNLRRSLKSQNEHGGEAIPRAFLQALAHLIGGYRDALNFRPGEPITFDDAAFVASRPPAVQPFLQDMLHLQIFRQFIEERIEAFNRGKSFSDEFEIMAVSYSEKLTNSNAGARIIKSQYEHVKRESGAFVKAVKSKANPAVKTAVKSVREGSKLAYKEVKHKIRDNQSKRVGRSKFQMSSSPSSASIDTSDGVSQSAPDSPSSLGGRRTMSVLNVASTGGSLTGSKTLENGSVASGLTRYNTEFGFGGRVLKYERFDPPPMGTLDNVRPEEDPFSTSGFGDRKSLINEKSPDMEAPPRLDLDLMTDMQEMFFKNQPPERPPPVHRELKPSLKRTPALSSQNAQVLIAPDKNSDAEIEISTRNTPAANLRDRVSSSNPFLQTMAGNSNHPKLERANALNADNTTSELNSSPVIDLISLGGMNTGNDDVIFDPLLDKGANGSATYKNSVTKPMLPRPPSAKVAAITQMYEQQLHKPLVRDSANPFRNGVSGNLNYENCSLTNGEVPVLRPASLQSESAHSNQRSIFTKSSEDLLREYGLDFSRMSVASSLAVAPTVAAPVGAVTKATPVVHDKFDIFADLDPFQKSSTSVKTPVSLDSPAAPVAPVAPPRTKKTSAEKWTTFE